MSKTPFPGMDPYLEHPSLWPDVHNRLIAALADAISPTVAPNYYVGVESRAYVIKPEGDRYIGRPDISVASPVPISTPTPTRIQTVTIDEASVLEVEFPFGDEITHYYLEIRAVQTHELITIIEILSPVNKIDKRGRTDYEQKRYDVIMSRTNLIEIDLLRAGDPLPMNKEIKSDYRLLVSRSWTRRKAQLYAFNLHVPIPDFPLPLQQEDKEPLINLNQVLHDLYGRARFDLRLDYTQPPVPPLTEKQRAWATNLLLNR